MKTFPFRLKMLRGRASQLEMAEKYGVTQPAYGKWENGKAEPKFATLVALCDDYSVSADWLLGRTDKRSGGVSVNASGGSAVAAQSPGAKVAAHAPAPSVETSRLLDIIESQQRVIETLSKKR